MVNQFLLMYAQVKALLSHDMIPFSVSPLQKETQITCVHPIARFSTSVKIIMLSYIPTAKSLKHKFKRLG